MSAVLEVDTASRAPVDAAEQLRADLYGLLAILLSAPPGEEQLAQIAALTGDDTAIGKAVAGLAAAARDADAATLTREYDALFIGLGRGALLPYGSYYLTGFLNEKPLAILRSHMAKLDIERGEGVTEPEDHIASLCEMMAGLIRGSFGDPVPLAEQEAFFNTHIGPWAGHFFADLEGARPARFYVHVGRIGRAFIDIEYDAFRMLR
ncbi:MAG: molecular chaperone TorD family protein [Pseudomonadota bacterium]